MAELCPKEPLKPDVLGGVCLPVGLFEPFAKRVPFPRKFEVSQPDKDLNTPIVLDDFEIVLLSQN